MTLDDRRALELALEVLDGELTVAPAEVEKRLWASIRRVFAAIDEVLLAAARGVPASEADSGPRPRHAVVLPLVRSNR